MRSASSTAAPSAASSSSSTALTVPVAYELAVGDLAEPEPLTPLDEDVHAAVFEARENLGDACSCPHVADSVVVGVHEPELALVLDALADQLLVALLEDVQREPLGRQKDETEREQSELVHPARVRVT